MARATTSAWRRPRLQRIALAGAGALPQAASRRLAGPGRECAGRRLEPDIEVVLGLVERYGWPDFTSLSPPAARLEVEREARAFAPRRVRGVSVRHLQVPGAAGGLAARLYAPDGAGATGPLLLYLHGGGWVFGSPAIYDGLCRFIARHSGMRVLSASYRLAPENRFPAGFEDARATLRWTLANAASLGASRVGVGGDSAGGNLAAVLAHEAGERLAFQFLLCPVTDLSREHPSYSTFADGPFLTAQEMRWFRAHYLSGEEAAQDPRASPLLAPDLAATPPTYLAVAGFDPLCDEALAYGARLREAGIDVTLALHEGQVHGFAELIGPSPSGREATIQACRWLSDH